MVPITNNPTTNSCIAGNSSDAIGYVHCKGMDEDVSNPNNDIKTSFRTYRNFHKRTIPYNSFSDVSYPMVHHNISVYPVHFDTIYPKV